MASACSTHPPPSPAAPPRQPATTAMRLPTPVLGNLSPQWQSFAREFGLSYRDVLGLMNIPPVPDLDAEILVIVANKL